MAITPYLRLQKPPFDDIPWDDAVNTNMDKIDAFAAQFLGIPNYVGAWQNATAYVSGQNVSDVTTAAVYQTHVTHTSSALPTTFAQERVLHPTYWELVSTAAPPSTLSGNVGRNLIHNPLFNIAQRGTGPFTTSVYTADRWRLFVNVDTNILSIGPVTDASRAAIGDEAATSALSNTVTGNAGATAFSLLTQPIEGVRRLAGKTVTVSFWAVCISGTPKIGVSLDQSFGSGGSASTAVNGTGQAVSISTTWSRYSLIFVLPSATGKILGTDQNDATFCNFWFSSGANNASRAGNIGVQSGNFILWGVQLEIGSVATPLEKPDPVLQIQQCQRFFRIGVVGIHGYQIAGSYLAMSYSFGVFMRTTPVVNWGVVGSSNMSAPGTAFVNQDVLILQASAIATGDAWINANFAATADL